LKRGSRPGRETALAALFFLGWTVVATWPQALHMRDALSDFGDAKLVSRILQWDFAQTFRDPRELFQLNFFHPARYVLAFSENLYGVSFFGFPLLAAGASAVLNYNVLLLLGMFSSALSAWALARYVTGDPLASTAAGVVYAFLPWRMEQIPHLQFQWGAFLCLALLFLLRYLESGRRRDLVLYAVAFGWNALANVHYAFFSGFLLVVALAWVWLRDVPERRRRIVATVLATAVASLPFLPFAAGYRAASRLYGFRRGLSEIHAFSGQWTDFLSAGEKNWLWGPVTARFQAPERHFFPGAAAIVLAVAAIVILWRRRARPVLAPPGPLRSARRRSVARLFDLGLAILAVLWLFAQLRPGLTLGALRLRDPGRILVLFALVGLLRLAVVFPGRRFRSLGEFMRSGRLDPPAALLLGLAGTGVLVAFGANTPFYRFLVQSFSAVFLAIRAPSRGIVLFHIALAVLAAWGLSLLTRRGSARSRFAGCAAAFAVLMLEYRVFPLPLIPTPGQASAVYRWMRAAPFPGAAVEWPLGFLYDFEYVLRQAAHEKPILNGYSGFFPAPYVELEALLKKRPIPETEVWPRMRALGASVLVYHAHEGRGYRANAYSAAVRRGVSQGAIELLGGFPHEGLGLDFAFRLAGSPDWPAEAAVVPEGTPPPGAARLFEKAAADLDREVKRLAPPFGVLQLPEEGQRVSPGFWAFGWALDDSGIDSVRVTTGSGDDTFVTIGGRWPHLEDVHPGYTEPGNGGYGFAVPALPPGRATLRIRLIGRDGGETTLERVILVEPAPSPTPPGPGS
jgi:hypothetical protein